MEKRDDSDRSCNSSVLPGNKTLSNSDFLKLHQTTVTQPFPPNMPVHHHSRVPDDDDDGGGTAGGGPTSGAYEAAVGYMCRHEISPDGSGAEDSRRNSIMLQPFDDFHASYSTSGMATGFPFTDIQRKELEMQAMIFKCMISYVPVPPHLLFSLSTNFPVDSSVPLVYGGRKGDAEPGRCKRTDGKKWRCSREVAPQQKYCERHLHRGRPRSRKLVEANTISADNHKKTRLQPTKTHDRPLPLKPKTDPIRDLGLIMGGEATSPKQSWDNLMEANIELPPGYTSSNFDQDYALSHPPPLNLFCYPDFSAPETELPTGFVDAWSIDNMNSWNNGGGESSGDLSPSLSVSMAMAAGIGLDDQMRNVQTDWEPFARGGPLGEALQPGSVAARGSNPASPYNSISTPVTTVSSPSGVLQWTLFSHSDGSSPTLAAAPEISNYWHS